MTITGKLIAKTAIETFSTKDGNQQKQNLIIETDDKYPKIIAVEINPAKLNSQFNINDLLECEVNLSSREWQGKWFNQIQAWKISVKAQGKPPQLENTPNPQVDNLPW